VEQVGIDTPQRCGGEEKEKAPEAQPQPFTKKFAKKNTGAYFVCRWISNFF